MLWVALEPKLLQLGPVLERLLCPIPLLIVVITLVLKMVRREDPWLRIVFLDPDHGLAKQMLFWLMILTPVSYFLLFGWPVWREYNLLLGEAGYAKFLEISKIPLGLLGLSIPLTALVAKLHATSQTAKQIEKSRYDLFYQHRKEFTSYYDQVGETPFPGGFTTSYKINPRVHERLFEGDAANGTPVRKEEVMDTLVRRVKRAEGLLKICLTEGMHFGTHDAYFEFCQEINSLLGFFTIKDIEHKVKKSGVKIAGENGMRTIGTTSKQAISGFRVVRNYLVTALEFSGYRKGLQELEKNRVNFDSIRAQHPEIRTIEEMIEAARAIDGTKPVIRRAPAVQTDSDLQGVAT